MSIVGSVSVRVVPSFSGFHKQIGRQFTGAGEQAGKQFSGAMGASINLQSIGGALQGVGDRIAGVGSSLTRNVTRPAGIAATAVGGLVTTLGMGRLVGLDSAQAKLRGLGYDAEEVERISGQVTDAIEGTMVTMAEGTNIAAGAMAAGVDEGKDLQSYIRLVGDAAAAAGRPVDEMAMIFNRVQGSGKLMTQELNMLEQSVPGVSQALADSYGVSYEAFREMVTNGEVDAAHFREVMDEFMGGMGEEYSNSFAGMAKNVVNYIGILGENLLSGAFPQMKDELADFVDFLASDDVATWAQGIGESIGSAFSTAVEWVKTAIDWWVNLDGSTQKLILQIAGLAVALGPVLLIGGKIISFFGGLITAIGKVRPLFAPLWKAMTASTSSMTALGRALVWGGKALRFITGPIGLVIGALIAAWTNSESFREAIVNMGKAIWDAISGVWEALQPLFSGMGTAMSGVGSVVAWLGGLLGDVLGWTINTIIIPAINWLGDALAVAITWITGMGDETTEQGGVMTSVWEWIQGAISAVAGWIMETAVPWIVGAWESISAGAMKLWDGINTVWDGIVTGAQWLWGILEPIFLFIAAVFLWVGETMWNIWTSYIKLVWDTWVSVITWVWNSVLKPIFNFIASAFEALGTAFKWVWDNVIKPMWDSFVEIVNWVWNSIIKPIFSFIVEAFQSMGRGFQNVYNNIIKPVFNFVADIIRWLWNNIVKPYFGYVSDSWERMANWLRDVWRNVLRPVIKALGDFVVSTYRNYIRPALGWIRDRWDWLTGKVSDIWNNTLKPIFQAVGDFVKDDVVGMVRDGVDLIGDAWNAVANFFRTPINWVINTVWNDGIRGAFNAVSDAVGSSARLGKIPNIGRFGGGGGSRGNIPGYAKGGRADKGWALVGEEGPELVNFSQPGRVYTADETRDALTGAPGGIGDPWYSNSELEIGKQAGREAVGGALADAWDWVRGKLADGVSHVVQPLLDKLGEQVANDGTMGQLGVGLADWGFNSVLDWARGKDEEAIAGGQYDGEFTANPGGFNRPAQGMISSMAGTRSYWGAFGNQHYGVDIANSVGSIVRAAWDGVVKRTSGGGLDRMMVLNHGSYDTAYLHNSGFLATPGQEVSGGQPIARMGSAGTGPHLHFELHPGGWYNPSVGGVNALFRDKGGLIYPGLNQVMNGTGKAEYAFNQQQFDNLNKIAASSSGGEGWQITQNNYQSNNQHRDAQDLRMTFRRERRKAGV